MTREQLKTVYKALKRLIVAASVSESDCTYDRREQEDAHQEALQALALLERALR